MHKRHLHIDKIYISGEEEGLPKLLRDYRAGVVRKMQSGGLHLMPHPNPRHGKAGILQQIDDKSIHDADAYVFVGRPDPLSLYLLYFVIDQAQTRLPGAMLKDTQGKMIRDKNGNATLKPIIILNQHAEYDAFLRRCEALAEHGAVKKKLSEVAHIVKKPEEIRPLMRGKGIKAHPLYVPQIDEKDDGHEVSIPRGRKPVAFICCGFSLKGDYFEAAAEKTAELIAESHDITTGGGRGGLMMAVQKGAHKIEGAHVNCVSFKALSPLEEGRSYPQYGMSVISHAKAMPHRIAAMTNDADSIVILPGGFGTDTECIGPLMLKQLNAREHCGHPTIIQNLINPKNGKRIHDSLIALIKEAGFKEGKDFVVVEPELVLVNDKHGALDVKASAELAAQMTVAALQAQRQAKALSARRR